VARGTNLNVEFLTQGRAGLKLIAAAANYLDLLVFWVNISLHDCLLQNLSLNRHSTGLAQRIANNIGIARLTQEEIPENRQISPIFQN
jgi:hypothetical protein